MRKHHDLKCFPAHFQPVVDGTKTFEIRRNDRDFKEGDTFTLHEYEYDHGDQYTGRKISGYVGHISTFAQDDNYVVWSILRPGLLIIS